MKAMIILEKARKEKMLSDGITNMIAPADVG